MSKRVVIVSVSLDAGVTVLRIEVARGALAHEGQGVFLWPRGNRQRRLAGEADLPRTVFKKSLTLTNDDPSRSTDQKASLIGREKQSCASPLPA